MVPRKETTERSLIVRGEPAWQKVDDQPMRFWVDIRQFMNTDDRPMKRSPTLEVGMAQGNLSDKEIAVQVVREMFDAVMARDYDKAGKLLGGVPGELVEKRMASRRIVRVLSIGEPEVHEGKSDHFRVVVKCEMECDGQRETGQEAFSVEPVEDQARTMENQLTSLTPPRSGRT